MQDTEQLARQLVVPPQGVQQPAHAGLERHACGEVGDDDPRQDHGEEQVAADHAGDLEGGAVHMLEGGGGVRQVHEVRRADVDRTADQCDQQDRARQCPARVAGLLAERGQRVETQERVRGNGGAGHAGGEGHVRVEERLGRQQPARAVGRDDVVHAQADEHDDDGQLRDHQQHVEAVGDLDAQDIKQRGGDDEADDPHPLRHLWKGHVEVAGAEQPDQHRDEEVIEQGGPAHHEAEVRAQHLASIGVGRTGDREHPDQPAIAQGREHHADCRDQVGHRRGVAAGLRDHAIGAEHDQRSEERQTEQQNGKRTQRALQ